MATFKHISSKNADYGAAEQYLTFEHDEFTMKPTLDENGRLVPREDYNHAATIRRWAADDTAKAAPKKGIPDYTYKEGESL